MNHDEIEAVRAARGKLLRKQFYVIFMTPIKPMTDPGASHPDVLRDHLAYQNDLEARGILFGAGPFRDKGASGWESSAWDGSGMAIVRAGSQSEAEAIAVADPMHKAGLRKNTVRPWQMNEGSVTVTVRYAAGSFDIA